MYIGLTYYVKYNEKGLEEGNGRLWTIGHRYIDLLCYFIDWVMMTSFLWWMYRLRWLGRGAGSSIGAGGEIGQGRSVGGWQWVWTQPAVLSSTPSVDGAHRFHLSKPFKPTVYFCCQKKLQLRLQVKPWMLGVHGISDDSNMNIDQIR